MENPIEVSYWWCEVQSTIPHVLRAKTKKALEELTVSYVKSTKPKRVAKTFATIEDLIADLSNYPTVGFQRLPMWEKKK